MRALVFIAASMRFVPQVASASSLRKVFNTCVLSECVPPATKLRFEDINAALPANFAVHHGPQRVLAVVYWPNKYEQRLEEVVSSADRRGYSRLHRKGLGTAAGSAPGVGRRDWLLDDLTNGLLRVMEYLVTISNVTGFSYICLLRDHEEEEAHCTFWPHSH